MDEPRVEGAPRVEPAGLPEMPPERGGGERPVGQEGGEVPEERRHLQEVRVQEEIAEPDYADLQKER